MKNMQIAIVSGKNMHKNDKICMNNLCFGNKRAAAARGSRLFCFFRPKGRF